MEQRKLREKTETVYHFFFLERERDTNRKEKACVKRTKEGERDRNGAEKERA